MIKLNHLIKEHLIYEGLIHSVSVSEFEDMFYRWSITKDKFDIDYKKFGKLILVYKSNKISAKEFENLVRILTWLGWYISAYLVTDYVRMVKWKEYINEKDFIKNEINKNLLSLQVEPKYDLELTDVEFKLLYHISLSVYDEKIKRIGLIPKSLNKISYHPERIYFTRNTNEIETLAFEFSRLSKDKEYIDTKSFSVYEINIEGAKKNNRQIRLFNDPNFKDGIYTLSNIPPQFIKLIDTITIE